MNISTADITDLDFLVKLEEESFEKDRRSSRKSIRNSLLSRSQTVYIASLGRERIGSAIVIHYKKTMRIYSIAVAKKASGKGYGRNLVEHIIRDAIEKNYLQVTLEADAENQKLQAFYQNIGFRPTKRLPDYYAPGRDALKMTFDLDTATKNLVVTDYDTDFFDGCKNVINIRAQQYIEDPRYQRIKNVRVFNLCKSYGYQSIGYYVSLLAQARNQIVLPSLATLRDSKNRILVKSIGEEIFEMMQDELKDIGTDRYTMDGYFGMAAHERDQNLYGALGTLFEAPLMRYEFRKTAHWELCGASPIHLQAIQHSEDIKAYAKTYFSSKRFSARILKNYEYDLAILIDEHEAHPPSNKEALEHFKTAAEEIGFFVEFIEKKDYKRLTEFDALFIRTTTSLRDYTYDFSRFAYSEGLVVIDDPWSILGCSNKLFLQERLSMEGIKMPASWLLNKKGNYKQILGKLTYPVVLKQPDSAFSLGVHKASNREELARLLTRLFKKSELLIAQEFMPSDYDWRVGILNGKPLYACRYFMANGHWQIYNWDSKTDCQEGASETIPIEDVPSLVLKTAVKAASLMGDGLYGVDLKEIDGEVYVIEVNDNPSIDAGVEDTVLGPSLYRAIVSLLLERIENSRNIVRKLNGPV